MIYLDDCVSVWVCYCCHYDLPHHKTTTIQHRIIRRQLYEDYNIELLINKVECLFVLITLFDPVGEMLVSTVHIDDGANGFVHGHSV